MQTTEQITTAIHRLAKGRFDEKSIENFVSTFHQLTETEIVDSVLQISTDEGDELEVGFFTKDRIVDITLSKGKVYSYSYPIRTISQVTLVEQESKWVLTISGEKKFDYNVVKPASIEDLKRYEQSLRNVLRNNVSPKYWFKRKKYGKGWTPATLEGWSVLLAFVALLSLYPILAKIGFYEFSIAGYIIHAVILFLVLLRIAFLKGEPL